MHLGALGSVSLRVVLALAASTGLTAAVALPMAYQAHAAQDERATRQPPAAVLGVTTVPGAPTVSSDGLHWSVDQPELPAELLEGAVLSEPVRVFVAVPQLIRVDIRLGDEPTRSDFDAPFELRDGEPIDVPALDAGPHTVTATLTYDDGRTELRQATFTVATTPGDDATGDGDSGGDAPASDGPDASGEPTPG